MSADDVDERSAEEVTAAKEAVLEAQHLPFVQAILDGTLPTSHVVSFMGDASEEVREAALSVARAAVSGDAAAGKSAELLTALAKTVDGAGDAPSTRSADLARGAVVALYAHLASTTLPPPNRCHSHTPRTLFPLPPLGCGCGRVVAPARMLDRARATGCA